MHGQDAHAGHELGAVDEGEAFLGGEFDGGEAGAGEGLLAGQDLAFELGAAFAHEHEGEVGKGGEVARGADGTLRGDDGMDAAVEHGEEQFGDLHAYAGMPDGEHFGAQQHHGTDDVGG